MKTWWKASLVTVLALLLAIAPALALGEALDGITAKVQAFLDVLLAQGTPVGAQTLDAAIVMQDDEEVTYILADYLFITTEEDDDATITCTLSMLHADRPDEVDADALYAQFIAAVTGSELAEAAGVITWLSENAARTSYYGIEGAREFGDYTVILSASMTDSAESLSVLRFSDD